MPSIARSAMSSSWGASPATWMAMPSRAPIPAIASMSAGGPGGIEPASRPAVMSAANRRALPWTIRSIVSPTGCSRPANSTRRAMITRAMSRRQ